MRPLSRCGVSTPLHPQPLPASVAVGLEVMLGTMGLLRCPLVSVQGCGGSALERGTKGGGGAWGRCCPVDLFSSAPHHPGRGGEHHCHRQPAGDPGVPGPRGAPAGVPVAERWELTHTKAGRAAVCRGDHAPGDISEDCREWERKQGCEDPHLPLPTFGREWVQREGVSLPAARGSAPFPPLMLISSPCWHKIPPWRGCMGPALLQSILVSLLVLADRASHRAGCGQVHVPGTCTPRETLQPRRVG